MLTRANITTANGPLPANFLFGFAGSTGGATNVHEILCFRADPATSASSSAGASEKQSAKLETGVQAYFAYYNPSSGYTGRVTASSLGFDTYGNVVVASTPNWDASCVLTGVPAGSTCATTGVAGLTPAEAPLSPGVVGSRQILTWNGSSGVAFQYGNLTAAQQSAIDAGDGSSTPDRVNFLRGDRTNEINSAGTGEFRRRTGVLGDIVDSSPTWVGAPGAPYTANWTDRLNASATPFEGASGAQTYPAYASAQLNRTQMVYVGANDGLLHGFRSGTYNSSSGSCATTPSASCFTNNDGLELIAYMPGATLSGTSSNLIHPDTTNVANVPIDYANPQYGHQYYVDATPGAGDVFYNGQWHSWIVGGLGAGGAALYALDVTNPAQLLRVQCRKPGHGRVEQHHRQLRRQQQLRPEPGQYLWHPADAPPARRALGGDLRQRPGERFGRCRYLHHDARPEYGRPGCAVLLPEHRRRQHRQPQRHLLRHAGGPRR